MSNTRDVVEIYQSRSPIMNIPTELLSAIFHHCSTYSIAQSEYWYFEESNPSRFESDEAPLILTKICRLWRTVSQSTEGLWAVLPRFKSSSISPGSDQLFRLYLNYSGNAPLSIQIVLRNNNQGACVADLLSPHLHRAKQLIILDSNRTTTRFNHLLDSLRGNFNLLTNLRFEAVTLSISDIKLPWSQLTYLCGVFGGAEREIKILRLCVYLRYLDVHMKSQEPNQDEMAIPVLHLVNLRKLCIRGGRRGFRLLECLHAPSLEKVLVTSHPNVPTSRALELINVCNSRCNPDRRSDKAGGGTTTLEHISGRPRILKRCRILSAEERHLTQNLAQQLQDVAEGFQDDPEFRALLRAIDDILTSGSTKRQFIFNLIAAHDIDPLDALSKQFYLLDAAFKFLEDIKSPTAYCWRYTPPLIPRKETE
ncbi:hypothetical protein BD779DRAFT_1668638 [Infundibulicybe gibba]|nr:hypothetical protein BD779DRAFT_1668638 [Infundibulicybe gibba]